MLIDALLDFGCIEIERTSSPPVINRRRPAISIVVPLRELDLKKKMVVLGASIIWIGEEFLFS